MKNVLKCSIFTIVFIILCQVIGSFLLPWHSIKNHGIYNSSAYEILWEERDSIDVIFLGDSLVYNSISPMEIYNEYGFATFDCVEAAQLIENSYEYLKVAIESQHPNVVFFETNVLYRSPKYKPIFVKGKTLLKNVLPIYKYHDNWKKISFKDEHSSVNYYKGYRPSIKKYAYNNAKVKVSTRIPEQNMEYFEKMVQLCKENNIKLILLNDPSKNNWSQKRHNKTKEVAEKYNLELIDLNNIDSLDINWKTDTKDYGEHLNYEGAKKVSHYIGNYLKQNNLATNHKNDENYKSWDAAYIKYQESFNDVIAMA